MHVIDNDHVVCFDVDNTLVIWNSNCHPDQLIPIPNGKYTTMVKPHQEHIELVMRYKAKGKTIVVWSASGYEWAEAVVEALDLTDYVDYIMTKPEKYVDDLHADEWMEHTYIGKVPGSADIT